MTLTIHEDIIQGSEEWHQARLGLLTASEMKLVIAPSKLQLSSNDKAKSHFYELLAQRISGYVEPCYVSDDMMRGKTDEYEARVIYSENYAPVKEVGFVTNDKWGFTLGCSPDGLVGDDGAIEVKGRCQKYQVQTILTDEVPDEYMLQIQTGLLVTERRWCDFISFSAGLPMYTKRVFAQPEIQAAIVQAAKIFHQQLDDAMKHYEEMQTSKTMRLIPTERRPEEITI